MVNPQLLTLTMSNELKSLTALLSKTRAKTEKTVEAYRKSLPSYQLEKKLEDLIATLNLYDAGAAPALPFVQPSDLPTPYTLTTKTQKKKILAIVDHELESADNRAHSVDELEELLVRKKVKIPGKSPRSTLAALLSRNKKRYERVGEKRYRLLKQ